MSFKLRNTLTLLIITIILALTGYYVIFVYYPKNIEKNKSEINQFELSIQQMPEREQYYQSIQNLIDEKKTTLASLDKTIESDISAAQVFSYLDAIQDRYGAIRFDLTFVKEIKANGYSYRIFQLRGEGAFEAILSIMWILERGPKLFSLEQFTLRGVESTETDENKPFLIVPFDMKIRALYADIPDLPQVFRSISSVEVPPIKNLFYPLIARNLPPNPNGLLESERSELRAILPDKTVIADPDGKIHILSEGDEVYLGYLTKINPEKNWVEFTLNKGGIVEKFILKLKFTAEQE